MCTGRISLDQVDHCSDFDLKRLFESQYSVMQDDENDALNNALVLPTCQYYSPGDLSGLPGYDDYRDTNSFSFFSLNCRSLSAHWDDFKDLVVDITKPSFDLDIIGLSEIFKINNEFNLPGYHDFIHSNRPEGDDNRGGVGFFIKDEINYTVRSDLSIFIPHVIETLFIEITKNHGKPNIVGIIYRPNSPPLASIDVFQDHLSMILNKINLTNVPVCLMGDFNIDLIKFTSHTKTNSFLESMISAGMLPVITKPTRITDHSATLIDHVYTNMQGKISTGILITDISDHFGTICVIETSKRVPSSTKDQYKYIRNFNDKNTNRFKAMLHDCDFSHIFTLDCPNVAYNNFMQIYTKSFEMCFPLKQTKRTKKTNNS